MKKPHYDGYRYEIVISAIRNFKLNSELKIFYKIILDENPKGT